jgi:hypothetical protein
MSSAADRYEKKRESNATRPAGSMRRQGHREPEPLARELIGFVTKTRLPR